MCDTARQRLFGFCRVCVCFLVLCEQHWYWPEKHGTPTSERTYLRLSGSASVLVRSMRMRSYVWPNHVIRERNLPFVKFILSTFMAFE